MNDPATTAGTQMATTAPDNQAVPDDLRVADWLYASDPELEADDLKTVGDVRQAFHDVYLSDSYSQCWSPAVFTGTDGRVYAAEIGVVVRPATPEEVREAVEEVRASTLNAARSRVETLDRYLSAPAT